MDNFQIETAQNVNIVQNTAGVVDRCLAFLLDLLLIGCYIILMAIINAYLLILEENVFIMMMTFTLPPILYHLLWEMFWNGQSPGKAVMKIRVVKLDGSKPEFSNYLLRWLLRLIDIGASGGGVALVTILLNGKGQRVGDIAAATTVISEKQRVGFSQTILMDIPDGYVPKYPQVTVFNDIEMQTIKNVFTEARYNGNHNVVLKLAKRVSKVMEITPEETPILFLDRVVKDYNFYTQGL